MARTSAAAKTTKSTKAPARSRTGATSRSRSKKVSSVDLSGRKKFVAGAVLATALLVSISLGFSSVEMPKQTASLVGNKQPGLYLQASSPSAAIVGSTVSVVLYENSGKDPVNTVQSAIQYPADRLELVSLSSAKDFPTEAATDTKTPGLIRLARSVKPDASPVTGLRPVATAQFKVIASGDSLNLGIDKLSSFLMRSTDNKNIL